LILAFELLRLPAVFLYNHVTEVAGRVPWVGTVLAVGICLFVLVLALGITLVAKWTRAPGEAEKKRGRD
jgi:hypothetical protein